jgi:uncharacterized protein YyaL (SSP411 family)
MMRYWVIQAASLLVLAWFVPADAAEPKPKHSNRLSREISPYLLQHAHNPVDWYPWGEEAFAKAKKEGKLVFLSIGYSSCHWCHVMERESFSNEAVAKILNTHFVSIKVDREERPDIDQVYMTAINVLGQRGGWPLSVFLTADAKPIFGGTYWPPEDKEEDGKTYAGFKTILARVQELHSQKRKELEQQADRLAEGTREALAGVARGTPLIDLDRRLVAGAVDGLKEEFDKVHGGFGSANKGFRGPKFPTPPYLLLLQKVASRSKADDLDEMIGVTLDHMSRGGAYDHIGGGFHRYSTERSWTVPHFEKMLYDQAQLCEVYSNEFRRTKKAHFRRVLQETVAFVLREMTAPDGGFYSALDADSEDREGRFYVWTDEEIDAALENKQDAALLKRMYGADGPANFEEKYHILLLPKPLAEQSITLKSSEEALEARLAPLRKKLLDVRAKRPRPFLDTKILTAWNGQMVAGMARAGQALGDREVLASATRAADFVLKNLRTPDGRLLRTYGGPPGQKGVARLGGYLDDYAFLIHGLLTLDEVTGEKRWRDEAKAVADAMVKFHLDKDAGGFFYTANDREQLFARAKDQYDSAQPSGNSMAAQDLVALWVRTSDEKYRALAERTIKSLAAPLKTNPTGLTGMALALELYLDAAKK